VGTFSLGTSEIFTAEFSHFLMTNFCDFLRPPQNILLFFHLRRAQIIAPPPKKK
jgi:hypothetical protein